MDFTINALKDLFMVLRDSGFSFLTVESFAGNMFPASERTAILRHDIDRLPFNALACAQMESLLDIQGTYYFRITRGSYNSKIIREISSMGHEIGYHYEDLSLVAKKNKPSFEQDGSSYQKLLAGKAYESFTKNLERLRELVPVKTACMHGSPLSRWDSRQIWRYFDYKELGIVCEPYFDIILRDIHYLTDTGRRWNGSTVSVRDRVYHRDMEYYSDWVRKPVDGSAMAAGEAGNAGRPKYSFKTTGDIIRAVRENSFPDRVLITCHPQRWSLNAFQWFGELTGQKIKNGAKYFIAGN